MNNIYKSAQVAAKHLISINGRMTTKEIIAKLAEFPEFKNNTTLKNKILNPLQEAGQLFKKVDNSVINPKTKAGTFYWQLEQNDKIIEAYKAITRESSNNFSEDPLDKIELNETYPLLGRTGPYAHFAKRGEWNGDINLRLKRQLE
jgi:hypothetical protein